jgi:hypothetical protein
MFDPVSIGVALTAVQSAVKLVKQASQTVNDVTSLGPVLSRYFDAKADAIKVVQESKKSGFKGSALGQALELEMALEQAREFEEQVKMLFFQSNKMDVWMKIAARARQIEADLAHDERKRKEAAKIKKAQEEEIFWIALGVFAIAFIITFVVFLVWEFGGK